MVDVETGLFLFFPDPSSERNKEHVFVYFQDILKGHIYLGVEQAPSGTPGWMTCPGLPKLMLMMFGHSMIFGSTPRSPGHGDSWRLSAAG